MDATAVSFSVFRPGLGMTLTSVPLAASMAAVVFSNRARFASASAAVFPAGVRVHRPPIDDVAKLICPGPNGDRSSVYKRMARLYTAVGAPGSFLAFPFALLILEPHHQGY